jgi:hypothetical protein
MGLRVNKRIIKNPGWIGIRFGFAKCDEIHVSFPYTIKRDRLV